MKKRTSWLEEVLDLRHNTMSEVMHALRNKGILKANLCYPVCENPMIERARTGRTDESVWVCKLRSCSGRDKLISIRTGSFFANFKLSLVVPFFS